MLGIALGLASSLSWGISDFLGGLQARRLSAITVLLVSQPVGLALAHGLADQEHRDRRQAPRL